MIHGMVNLTTKDLQTILQKENRTNASRHQYVYQDQGDGDC